MPNSMQEKPDRQGNENDVTGRVEAPCRHEPVGDVVSKVRTGPFRKQAAQLKSKVVPEDPLK